MLDGAAIEFLGSAATLKLTLLSRPYSDDPDFIRASVVLEAHEFHGEFEAGTWSWELRALRQVLAALDRQVGRPTQEEFSFLDARVSLIFELTKQGHILIHGKVERGAPPDWTHLEFIISSDQTFLPVWMRAVDQALAQFPPGRSEA